MRSGSRVSTMTSRSIADEVEPLAGRRSRGSPRAGCGTPARWRSACRGRRPWRRGRASSPRPSPRTRRSPGSHVRRRSARASPRVRASASTVIVRIRRERRAARPTSPTVQRRGGDALLAGVEQSLRCRVAASRAGRPSRTRSPRRDAEHEPGAGIDRVVGLRARPAPSSIAARPTPSASKPATKPSRGADRTSRDAGDRGSSAESSATRGSPPCAATHSPERSERRARSATALGEHRARARSRRARLAEHEHLRAEHEAHLGELAGPSPCSDLDRLARPRARCRPRMPSGWSMSVSTHTTLAPERVADARRARAASCARRPRSS